MNNNNTTYLIAGGEILNNDFKMFSHNLRILFCGSLFLALFVFTIKVFFTLKDNDLKNTFIYILADHYVKNDRPDKKIQYTIDIKKNINNQHNAKNIIVYGRNFNNKISKNKKISVPAIFIIKNNTFVDSYKRVIISFKDGFYFALQSYVYLIVITLVCFYFRGRAAMRNKYVRGGKIVDAKTLNKIVRKKNGLFYNLFKKIKNKGYKIAGIIYPKNTETLHTLILGSTGSGKTVILSDLVEQIKKNGDRAIIYDITGSFIQRFYNKDKDIILNPLDERSAYWSVFNEANGEIDFTSIAAALIPDAKNPDGEYWIQAARALFSSTATGLQKAGVKSNDILVDKLMKVSLEEAAKFVKGTTAQAIIDTDASKTSSNIRSVLATNLQSLKYLREDIKDGDRVFSIKEWIRKDNNDGEILFITSRQDVHEVLKPLISVWIDIAINTLLTLKSSSKESAWNKLKSIMSLSFIFKKKKRKQKTWIILEELASLHFLPSLPLGLQLSRQFGGCFVLTLQALSQLQTIYGEKRAETTSALCNTKIILREPDAYTASWCSENLGKVEIEEIRQSISFGPSDYRDGRSLNSNIINKYLVLPTEIMNLDPLNGYIKLSGNFPIAKIKIKPKTYNNISEDFIRRTIKNTTDSISYNSDNIEKNINIQNIDINNNSNEFNSNVLLSDLENKIANKIEEGNTTKTLKNAEQDLNANINNLILSPELQLLAQQYSKESLETENNKNKEDPNLNEENDKDNTKNNFDDIL